MDHLPKETIAFLVDLDANNNKEWFQANKKRYERELKGPGRAFVTAVNERLREIAPELARDEPHKALNRINRDIRFSKDKTPYNTHLWAGFGHRGYAKGASAGLYFGLSPESWGVGGGTWKVEKPQLEALRATIAERHGELRAIVTAPGFEATFGELTGDGYKRVPKPYPAGHPAAEWLKLKSVHVRSKEPAAAITQPGFLDRMTAQMQALLPLIRYLQAGMES